MDTLRRGTKSERAVPRKLKQELQHNVKSIYVCTSNTPNALKLRIYLLRSVNLVIEPLPPPNNLASSPQYSLYH